MRKRVLYTGLRSPKSNDLDIKHIPFIEIIPRSIKDQSIQKMCRDIQSFSHIIFTSQTAVHLFFDLIDAHYLIGQFIVAVGQKTANVLKTYGISVDVVPAKECQEGIIKELEILNLEKANILVPCSSLSRDQLKQFLFKKHIQHEFVFLYDTISATIPSELDLQSFDEVFFTSPSTVNAFFDHFTFIPSGLSLKAIGPITQKALKKQLEKRT